MTIQTNSMAFYSKKDPRQHQPSDPTSIHSACMGCGSCGYAHHLEALNTVATGKGADGKKAIFRVKSTSSKRPMRIKNSYSSPFGRALLGVILAGGWALCLLAAGDFKWSGEGLTCCLPALATKQVGGSKPSDVKTDITAPATYNFNPFSPLVDFPALQGLFVTQNSF